MPVEQVLYIYKIYKYLIDYLIKHKACLAHLKPSYLLCYKDYVMFMTREPYDPRAVNRKVIVCDLCESSTLREFCHSHSICHTLLSNREFVAYASQAWVDLILQIHKTLALSKVLPDTSKQRKLYSVTYDAVGDQSSRPTLKESENTSLETSKGNDLLMDYVYSNAERILLNWLENNFKIQLTVLWTPSEFKKSPSNRGISNFCEDLSDGLVFAALTASYCPYLANMLTDVYTQPQNEEKQIGLMVACIGHDVDHPGVTNNFIRLIDHSISRLYNESPLENHHFQVSMFIIHSTKLFDHFPPEVFRDLTQEIHDAIIATDLELYFRCRAKILGILNEKEFDWTSGAQRVIWKKLWDKLHSMMDREKQYLIPEDQVQFVSVVCLPCVELLATLLPNCAELVRQCKELRDQWKEIIDLKGVKVWKPEDSVSKPE